LLAALAGRIYDHAQQQNAFPLARKHMVSLSASRSPIAIALALLLSGCAAIRGHSCRNGEQAATHESLGFGTAKPSGVVSAAEWDLFLKTTVTPLFPRGFATMESSGQWLGADGAVVREASHVLILDHPGDAASERAVREIISTYKMKFQQEAVFRVRSRVCISY
jgi:hypothetical protein